MSTSFVFIGRLGIGLLVLSIFCPPVYANISGLVLDQDSNPVAGAVVRLQNDDSSPMVVTGADGAYDLAVNPTTSVIITATVTYDPESPVNYPIEQIIASNGDTDVFLILTELRADNTDYIPPQPEFACEVCHADQVSEWQLSNHAEAATNTWVLDLFSGTGSADGDQGYVFTDTHDADETGFCATCHAPLADVFDPGNVMFDEVSSPGALAGVQCVACHQIDNVNENVNALAHLGNSTYRFPSGGITELFVWGPLPDVGFSVMNALHAPVFSESRFCASCHQYNNPFTDVVGQSTYAEWQASPFAVPGPDFATCQDCHMPPADAPSPISNIGNQPIRPAEQRRNHQFIGTTPQMLADNLDMTLTAEQLGDELVVTASITNFAGHSFPTGVSIRNALVHIQATSNGRELNQSSGSQIYAFADDDVPGIQPGDLSGQPGKGFGRVLQGRINDTGPVVEPVLFIDADSVLLDTRIPSGMTDITEVRFDLSSTPENSTITVDAELLWRRAWRELLVTKNWTTSAHNDGPVEIIAASESLEITAGTVIPLVPPVVPALNAWGLISLFFVILFGVVFGPFAQQVRQHD